MHNELKNSPVIVHPMHLKGKALHLPTIKHIADIARDNRIDVINAQASSDRYISVFAKHLFGLSASVVHTRRQIPKSSGNIVQNFLYAHGTDCIVAVSSQVKERLVELGLPAEHIHIIHNGTPAEKYQNIDEELVNQLRMRFGIALDDCVIGCVSRPKKQDQLIRALDRIGTHVKVMFVGCGREDFEQKFGPLPCGRDIIFTGILDNRSTLHCYRLFNICALPSTTEGLSQGLLEAMAMGVPVVATRAAGNLDLIREDVNGMLFEDGNIDEFASKISVVLEKGSVREKLIHFGKITALETFSLDATVAKYESLFMRLQETELLKREKDSFFSIPGLLRQHEAGA